ncbi:hypothetical protein IKQ19_09415 [Candidatus Saccharibacteria bacterium]|nr:hypothetical protein [Candidatus Saccharibacteria bacterium]
MLKEMKAKKINEAALEQVAGGTVKEFDELLSAVSDNLIVRGAAKLDSHTPVANAYIARVIEKQLLNIGLEADIDLGWGGTGIGSKHNKYRLNGKDISHKEACDYVRNYGS